MLNRLKFSAAALALVCAAPSASAQDADTVVATVNGTDITLGHVVMVYAGLPEEYLSLTSDALWDGIVNQLIQQSVLAETRPDELSRRVALALDNEKRAMRASEAVQAITENAITEAAVQEAYEAAYSDGGGAEFNASHILVETEAAARSIAEEARGGADFAELARTHSTGPSGPNGGLLGWFGPGTMVAPFEQAVVGLEIGEISDPVQTQFGWHIIQLNDARIQDAPPLAEVRQEIEGSLQQQAVTDQIDILLENATITKTEIGEIDTDLLRNLDLVNTP